MTINLTEIETKFLTQCGSCDAGLPMECTCPTEDYRPTMAALVEEVRQLRAVDPVERSDATLMRRIRTYLATGQAIVGCVDCKDRPVAVLREEARDDWRCGQCDPSGHPARAGGVVQS